MTYRFICATCGHLSEVVCSVKDYDTIWRNCRQYTAEALASPSDAFPYCDGRLDHHYPQAPGIAFKGQGWTPKYHA